MRSAREQHDVRLAVEELGPASTDLAVSAVFTDIRRIRLWKKYSQISENDIQ